MQELSPTTPTLARTSFASASFAVVKKSDERLACIREYARKRLSAEMKAKPRGAQAQIARRLGVSTAHIANLVNGKSAPGDRLLHALARLWGMTRDELEAAATGEKIPSRAAPPPERDADIDRVGRAMAADPRDIDAVQATRSFREQSTSDEAIQRQIDGQRRLREDAERDARLDEMRRALLADDAEPRRLPPPGRLPLPPTAQRAARRRKDAP